MSISPHQQSQLITEYLKLNLSNYLDMLHQMVNINSFTANPKGVNKLGKLTADMFAQLGFQGNFTPSINPSYGNHVVLENPGKGPHKIGLISHLDTVFSPEEEIQNQFFWRENGDRIYGPGTVDIKGGTVLIYMILDVIRKFNPQLYKDTNWFIFLNASEETIAKDFSGLCLNHLDGDALACLVFEGGRFNKEQFNVVTSRKGMAIYHLKVEGKASHAGSAHQEGANAIVQLAHTIQKIDSFTNYDKHLTFNVGTVSGGIVTNRIPHFAEAKIEMRAFSPETYNLGVSKIMALKNDEHIMSPDGFTCKIQVEILDQTAPWPENKRSNQLLRIWQAAGEELGFDVFPEARGGLSDGNLLWEHHPTLDALGPSGGNAHCSERSEDGIKDQEFVRRSSFVPKAVLNTIALQKLLLASNL